MSCNRQVSNGDACDGNGKEIAHHVSDDLMDDRSNSHNVALFNDFSPSSSAKAHENSPIEALDCKHTSSVQIERFRRNFYKKGSIEQCEGCIFGAIGEDESVLSKKELRRRAKMLRKQKLDISAEKLWICLTCVYIGCGKGTESSHIQAHYDAKPTHSLSLNAATGQVWCFACNSEVRCSSIAEGCREVLTRYLKSKGLDIAVEPFVFKQESVNVSVSDSRCVPGIRGLANIGNTCYFNSTLQALLATKPLVNFMVNEETVIRQSSVTFLLSSLFKTVWGDSEREGSTWNLSYTGKKKKGKSNVYRHHGNSLSPGRLLDEFSKKMPQFKGYFQHDAQELLRGILDVVKVEEQKSEGKEGKNVTKVDKVFCGKMQNTVVCDTCGNTSTVVEDFLDLSLPLCPLGSDDSGNGKGRKNEGKNIQVDEMFSKLNVSNSSVHKNERYKAKNNDEISLHSCLNMFTDVEHLTGINQFGCSNCADGNSAVSYQSATKQMLIHSPPVILCIHFKRFHQVSTRKYSKNSIHIEIPAAINIEPFCSEITADPEKSRDSKISTKYSLYGVVCHTGGGMGSGHYVAFCLSGDPKRHWYYFNDTQVTSVNIHDVKESEAYILLYERFD